MRAVRTIAVASVVAALCATANAASAPLPSVLQVLGSVTTAARPVGNALVIALNLNTLEANQTFSGSDGAFALANLPAAVYKIIAIKAGFAPAMTMVVPTKEKHRVALKLENEKDATANQRIWELRASLPPDVLRELDNVLAERVAALPGDTLGPRFRGEMSSMTAVSQASAAPAFAQTALGVESRLGDTWQLGFHGNLHRVIDPTENHFAAPVAESSVMQMELRSSPTDSVRVASTKSWWRYADNGAAPDDADIRSHNIEWEHGDARLQVRYLAQQNLFLTNPGSDLIEVAGNTTVMQSEHADIGVALRVTQESVRNSANTTYRMADLTASANLDVAPSLMLQYGMSSRVGVYGAEWAPRTGAEWKVTKKTSLVVSGMYKVLDRPTTYDMPSIVAWTDESRVLPHYSYSAGIMHGDEQHEGFSAIATVMRADAPLRVIFNDAFEQFWDGLYVDTGDVRHDLRVALRKELMKRVLVNLSSSAGLVKPGAIVMLNDGTKHFVTGDLDSTYEPTGTTLSLSYREMRQPLRSGDYRSERVNIRIAQSLHMLLDLKLLAGVEVARAQNSPYLLDTIDPDGTTRKYIGGLAFNF
jgi:hypothetical protein